jgi:hypothetical protein
MFGCSEGAMLRRYNELVELARICWRQSQKAQTEQLARTMRRLARDYLQEAAKLDGGKVPEIGLVCLKAQRGHANPPLQNSSASQSRFTGRVSYSDQDAAATRAFRVISSLTPTTLSDEASLAILRCANRVAADIRQRRSSEMALNNARDNVVLALSPLCALMGHGCVTQEKINRAKDAVSAWLRETGKLLS